MKYLIILSVLLLTSCITPNPYETKTVKTDTAIWVLVNNTVFTEDAIIIHKLDLKTATADSVRYWQNIAKSEVTRLNKVHQAVYFKE